MSVYKFASALREQRLSEGNEPLTNTNSRCCLQNCKRAPQRDILHWLAVIIFMYISG